EDEERRRAEDERERIARGREDRREHERDEDPIAPEPRELIGAHESQKGHEVHDQRELEDQPDDEGELEEEREVSREVELPDHVLVAVRREELEPGRDQDEVAEARARDEREERERREPAHVALLVLVQARGDELPQLARDERRRDEEREDHGHA